MENRLKSLSAQLLVALLMAVVAVLGTWGYAELQDARLRGQKQLSSDEQAIAGRLAYNLAQPLWNLNRADVERTLDYEAVNPVVQSALVYDESGALYAGMLRDSAGRMGAVDPKAAPPQLGPAYATASQPVLKNGKAIGRVQLQISDVGLRSQLEGQWHSLLLKLVALIVALSVVLYVVLQHIVISPLTQLTRWVSGITPGGRPAPAPEAGNKEIRSLTASFSQLSQHVAKDMEELKASEEWHRVLFERSQYALMTLSPPSWRFTSGNKAALHMFGARDEAEFTQKGPWDLSPEAQPDGQPSAVKAQAMIGRAMQEGSHLFDWRHKRLSGEEFPATVLLTRMQIKGDVLLHAMVRDETERSALQATLAKGIQNYETLYRSIPLPVFVYDFATRRFVDANPAACELLKMPAAEIVGLNLAHFIPPAKREAFIAELQKRDQMDDVHEFQRIQDSEGRLIDVEVNVRSIELEGKALRLVLMTDVTATREAQRQLLRFERLAAVGQTAAGLAHEVRNPLAAINMSTEFLKLQLADREALHKDLDSILRQTERLKALVNGVLERARSEDLELAEASAEDLLRSAYEAARVRFGQASERVDVAFDIPSPPPRLTADLAQMERVLMNLILNALQAMPSGGALTLAARAEQDGVVLEVADNGPGIPGDKRAKVFEPFFTTKSTGSGLGLWICKTIVEQHGGSIEALGVKPRGCRFRIRLPLKPEAGA